VMTKYHPLSGVQNLEPHFVKASLARCFSGSSGPVSLIHSEQVIGRSPHSIPSHRTRYLVTLLLGNIMRG
jgi:hypothetical protein